MTLAKKNSAAKILNEKKIDRTQPPMELLNTVKFFEMANINKTDIKGKSLSIGDVGNHMKAATSKILEKKAARRKKQTRRGCLAE